VRTPTRPTTGFLSPRNAIGKHLMPSSLGGRMARVAALQMVEPKSLEYTLVGPSSRCYRVCGQKVDVKKVLSTLLDHGE
jgi:hypothetical protein